MTQKQVELQKLISMEQKREKEYLNELDQLFLTQPTENQNLSTAKKYPLSETVKSLEKELNLDIYLSDKDLKKKDKMEKKKYSSTKVKARNFLTNISYNGIKSKDYENRTFVIDIFAYLILYFNSYCITGKFETETERGYINILWSQLLPQSFYLFVSKKNNIQILNKKNVKFQDAVEIIKLFIEVSDGNTTQESQFQLLQFYLKKYLKMYPFVFANLFPKYYSKFNSRSVENNIEFNSFYSNYLSELNILDWQKNTFSEQNLPIVVKDNQESESESDVEVVDIKKVKKEEKEEEKKRKRIKRKEDMQKQKKILEEKLKENTEKMYKIRKV